MIEQVNFRLATFCKLHLSNPEVINMQLLPIIFIHYTPNGYSEYSNFIRLKLLFRSNTKFPNNEFTRKCAYNRLRGKLTSRSWETKGIGDFVQHPRLLVQLFQWKFTKRRNKIKLNLVREAAKMLFKQQLILWLLHLIANN